MAATSANAVYGLISALPLLALPLVMGGVTGGEFGRVSLVLLATLGFSLSAGIFVSAGSRETLPAMGGTLLIVLLSTCILPCVDDLVELTLGRHLPAILLRFNPFHAYTAAADSHYRYGLGAAEYWSSMAAIVATGVTFLVSAAVILPRVWREGRPATGGEKRDAALERTRFGRPAQRAAWRKRMLAVNPFYWAAARDHLAKALCRVLFGALMALWLSMFLCVLWVPAPGKQEAWGAMMLITYGLHVVFKYMVAMEASRRLLEDRLNGTMELLLSTPLKPAQFLSGQRRALWWQFGEGLVALLALNGAIIWLMYGLNPMGWQEVRVAFLIGIGGTAMLVLDFFTLGWVGMWAAMHARNHQRAILYNLAQVLFLPWLIFFLMFALSLQNGATTLGVLEGWILFWFFFCAINDLVISSRAKYKLQGQFRRLASNAHDFRGPGRDSAGDRPAEARPA
jgi:hypothetical protein